MWPVDNIQKKKKKITSMNKQMDLETHLNIP